jgi:hypothetical protein
MTRRRDSQAGELGECDVNRWRALSDPLAGRFVTVMTNVVGPKSR